MSQPFPGDDLWCRRYRPARSAAARLVCLPHAGGSATFFLPVSAALSPGVDVVAIQCESDGTLPRLDHLRSVYP